MRDATSTEGGDRPHSLGGRMEAVCDRAEAAWKAGRPPRIEDLLDESPEPGRAELFRSLLVLEVAYRRRGGEHPTREEYRRRFPDHAGLIEAVFVGPSAPTEPPKAVPPPPPGSSGGSGRNLLFGLLALQNNFIDRNSLLAAFAAWVADKGRPLGRILLESGALAADTHALLEGLVKKHLEMHGDDPERSLATLSSLGPTRDALEGVADADLQASLTRVATDHANDDPEATRAYERGRSGYSGPRFRVLRFHKKGGLGQVSVARDEELHRDVALKEIQDRYAHDPNSRSRFMLEAEITGNLEHPGIIPVYGLGTYDDGRPFYAMRLIDGDNSLKDAIALFHAGAGPGHDPGEQAVVLRKLLRRFLDVCWAMDYAHSRGVLHRDLKPHNILLGPYGETLVVDWGLAKSVGRPAGSAGGGESTLRPESSGSSDGTRQGEQRGTPGYMSPEQAAGEIDRLGPASDVYSLGATLYCLLAGRAPFDGRDLDVLLAKVVRGELAPPRAVARATDPALEAICLKSMALRPEDRYGSPRALADDLEHWLADEPVSVFHDPWATRALRWARRHRWAVPTAVSAVPLLLLLATLVVVQGRLRTTEAEAKATKAASKTKIAEADAKAAKAASETNQANQRIALSEKYKNFTKAQQARQERNPGWTRVAIAALKEARNGPPGLVTPDVLRREAAACLAEWDLGPGEILAELPAFNHTPSALAFNSDGSRLAVAERMPGGLAFKGNVIVIEVKTGKSLATLTWETTGLLGALKNVITRSSTLQSHVQTLALSPDGRRVAIGLEEGYVYSWDLGAPDPNGSRIGWRIGRTNGCIRRLLFGNDSKTLFSSADGESLIHWSFSERPGAPPELVEEARFDGQHLFLREDGSKLIIVNDRIIQLDPNDFTRREIQADMSAYHTQLPLTISPDGLFVAAVAQKAGEGLNLLYRSGGGKIRTLREGAGESTTSTSEGMQFHPDGSLLLEITSSSNEQESTLRLWEVSTGRLVVKLPISGPEDVRASFTPDGRSLVMTGLRGDRWHVKSYKIDHPTALRTIGNSAHPVRTAALAPDGKTLAILTTHRFDGTAGSEDVHQIEATLWGLARGDLRKQQRVRFQYAAPTDRASINFHPDGSQLVFAGTAQHFFLWNLTAGGEVRQIPAGGTQPYATFADDGRLWGLVRISDDNTSRDHLVRIEANQSNTIESTWVASLNQLLTGRPGLVGIAAKKGMILVGAKRGGVETFVERIAPPRWPYSPWTTQPHDPVTCLDLSPDGRTAAIGTQSGKLYLKSAPGGESIWVIDRAHDRSVTSLAISSDGLTLATGSIDQTVRLWRLNGGGPPSDPLVLPSTGGAVRTVAFTPDGSGLMMLVEGEHAVRMWSLQPLLEELKQLGMPW